MSNIWLVSSRLYKLSSVCLKDKARGGRGGPAKARALVGGQDLSRDPFTKFPRKTLLTHPRALALSLRAHGPHRATQSYRS